ncbi:MAG TPA: tetratricopeptide repeat protein [Solimonas sp.]|nr:tetratricopeptide repeat protein [Solimonas sp.]
MKASSNPALKFALALALCAALGACKTAPKKDLPAPPGKETAAVPDKGDPQARFNAALGQLKAKQLQEAEQSLVALTKDFPEYSGPWTNLGIIYANSKRKPQAAVAFNKAAILNQENAVAFNWLGILARETGDYPRAQMAYDKVLKLDPNNALAHYNLAIMYDEHLKRPMDALPHYKEYQRLSGKQDLKVLAWVAEIEANAPKPAPAPAAATPAKGKAKAKPKADSSLRPGSKEQGK